VNGIVERGHGVYIKSIWRVLQGRTNEWPDILQLAVWADQITTKRTTGLSPYYLLYGQQPLFAFDISDRSWHTLEWPKINLTKELLAIRIKQLSRRDEYIGEASEKVEKSRIKAAKYFYEKNKARMSSREFTPGTFILVWNNSLKFQLEVKELYDGKALLLLYNDVPKDRMCSRNSMEPFLRNRLPHEDLSFTIIGRL
jgi:hypothetical protein